MTPDAHRWKLRVLALLIAWCSAGSANAQEGNTDKLTVTVAGTCTGAPDDVMSLNFDVALPSEMAFLAGPGFTFTADAVQLAGGWIGRATSVLHAQTDGFDVSVGSVSQVLRHRLSVRRSAICDLKAPLLFQYRLRDSKGSLVSEIYATVSVKEGPTEVKLLTRERLLGQIDHLFGATVQKYLGPSVDWFEDRELDRDAGRKPSTSNPIDLCYLCDESEDERLELGLAKFRTAVDPSYLMVADHPFNEWRGDIKFSGDTVDFVAPEVSGSRAVAEFKWLRNVKSGTSAGLYLASTRIDTDSYSRTFAAFADAPPLPVFAPDLLPQSKVSFKPLQRRKP